MRLAELEVPARAEFVSLARLVVSSLAGDCYVLDDDQLDNLKLAVSEALVMVIKASTSADESAVVECTGTTDGIVVHVNGRQQHFLDGAHGPICGGLPSELGVPLMGSLVDEVTVMPSDSGGGGGPLRLFVRCVRSEEL
jgi:anti-sigma regulatory factor (Ser/Thr protein kinase)